MLLTTSLQSVAQAPMPDFKSWIEQEIADPVARGEAAQASVSIIWQGQIVHLDGFGPREGPESPKTDPEADRFLIASITKTFTAMAVAQLVEDGTFSSLDAPANHYLKRIVLPEVDADRAGIGNQLRRLRDCDLPCGRRRSGASGRRRGNGALEQLADGD